MRIASSDWHLKGANNNEPADRKLIRELVAECVKKEVEELILLGDIFDYTRDCDDEAVDFVVNEVLKVLEAEDIYTTFMWGNHEGDDSRTSALVKELYLRGANPHLFSIASRGYLNRGKYQLEHGHRFDPWCNDRSSYRTIVGEVFTKLDHVIDKIGLNIETLNPNNWKGIKSPEFDHQVNLSAAKWASIFHRHLIFGHSHYAYELKGKEFSLYNTGSLTIGHQLEYVLFDDYNAELVQVKV